MLYSPLRVVALRYGRREHPLPPRAYATYCAELSNDVCGAKVSEIIESEGMMASPIRVEQLLALSSNHLIIPQSESLPRCYTISILRLRDRSFPRSFALDSSDALLLPLFKSTFSLDTRVSCCSGKEYNERTS